MGKTYLITYVREEKPPTLKQYLIRKAISEGAKKSKKVKGTVNYKGRLMPRSAKLIGDEVKGKTAEQIAKEHPEWVKEWEEKWKEK